MRTLPNIDLSKEEMVHFFLENFYSGRGGEEGIVIPDVEHRSMRKIFIETLGTSLSRRELEQLKDNKFSKVLWLHNHSIPNDISILATLSYKAEFVGYDMSYDQADYTLSTSLLESPEIISYLKKLRDKLTQFHERGIVYGDIKGQNILVNQRTGNINLCDLDNMQIEKYPIDLFNYCVFPFQDANGFIYPEADIYMQNLLLLTELDSVYGDPHEVLRCFGYGYRPSYLTKNAEPILQKTKIQSPKINEYLLDYLKN